MDNKKITKIKKDLDKSAVLMHNDIVATIRKEGLPLPEKRFTTRMVSFADENSVRIFRNRIDLADPKYTTMLHWHDFFELEMVMEGNAIHLLNGVSYPVGPGSLYMVTPADLHTLIPDPNAASSKLTVLNISFQDTVFPESSFVEVQTLPPPLIATASGKDMEDFLVYYQTIVNVKAGKGVYASEIISHLCFAFVFDFLRLYHKQHEDVATPGVQLDRESVYIRNAIAYIRYNFRDPNISCVSISKAICLSPNYFGTLFKKHFGKTCMSYIKTQRMNFAKVLLSSTLLTVNEIAEKCGYSSTPYFITDFHATFGVSPKQFKKQNES